MNVLTRHRVPAYAAALTALMCCGVMLCNAADDAKESLAQLTTPDGSTFSCMIDQSTWTMTTASGLRVLNPGKISSIILAERIDPNVENEVVVAVGDLQSETFETREKALAKLRGLGRAAARPLKQALSSTDTDVAQHARALLAEMGATQDDDLAQDRVQLSDGTVLRGEMSFSEVSARSHVGRLRVPVEALEKIVFIDKKQNANAPFATAQSAEINVPAPVAGQIESADAQAWDPNDDVRNDPSALDGWLAEAQRNALTMEKIPDTKAAPNGGPAALVDTKPGDRIEDAYREHGVLLHATEAGSSVEVSAEKLAGFSGGRSAAAKKSDLEIRFVLFNSGIEKREPAPAGVLHVGAVVRTNGPGSVGIAVYDAAGRLLLQMLNPGAPIKEKVPAPLMPRDEFLGVRSKTPIARVRFFRAGAMKEKDADILIDDVVYDRVSAAGLRGDSCRATLATGDCWVGKAVETERGCVALKTGFFGEKSEPLKIKLSDIARFEPARGGEANGSETKDDADKPRRFGTFHGVLLQSGEAFRARLLSLDDKHASFGLSGGALLKLPRETLRKIELQSISHEPAGKAPPTVIQKDEKPGVAFKTKPAGNNPSAPQPPEEKKDPDRNPAQGVQSMDNVEIISVDPKTWELTVKDDDGDFTIGMQGVRTLVFPAHPNAAAAAKKRGWTITLREGSRFDGEILQITPKDITAEMAGGTVVLPAETIEAVERK